MSINIKKKNIKLVITIISIIVVIIIIGCLIPLIYNSILINQTKEKIKSINVSELEKNLLEELENSKLNVNTENFETIFGNNETFLEHLDGQSELEKEMSIVLGTTSYYKTDNPYKEYISAYITAREGKFGANKSGTYGVIIPLFKIETDSEGNFQYILYSSFVDSNTCHIVSDVFKSKYDLDIKGKGKYNKVFRMKGMDHYNERIQIIYVCDEYVIQEIEKEINNYIEVDRKEVMGFFGID